MADSQAASVSVTAVRTVGKNTIVTLLGTVVNAVASGLLAIVAARYLGDEKFGVYGFAASFTALFGVFADLGLGTLAVRQVAQDRSRLTQYLDNIWTIRWVLGSALFLAACTVVTAMDRPLETRMVVYAVSASVFFGTLSLALRWSFQAFQVMEYEALCVASLSLLRLGGALGVLLAGYGVFCLALVDLTVNAILFVGTIGLVRWKFGWKPHWSWNLAFWNMLLRESYPLALMLVFATVYLNNSSVMLSTFVGDAATGWYNAANKLVGLLRFVPVVLIPAIYPVMSESYVLSQQRFAVVIRQSLRLLLLMGFPIAIFLTVFGDRVVVLIYGDSFINAVQPLQLLIWSVLLMFVSSVLGYGLISAGLQKVNATITGIGMLVNILLNWMLIPLYAAIGASMSLLVVEALVASLTVLCMRRAHLGDVTLTPLLRLAGAALAMGGMVYALRGHPAVSGLLGVVVYLVTLALTGSLSRDDYRLVARIFVRG